MGEEDYFKQEKEKRLARDCKYDPSKDYYVALGVSSSSSEKEIKRVFRKLAEIYHPDAPRDTNVTSDASEDERKQLEKERKQAEEKFKSINNAYEVLSDFEKRRVYDNNKKEYEYKRAEEKDEEEKADNFARIRDLFESGDSESAVREAKSLFARFPDDADYQNYYAALLHGWATRLWEKGQITKAADQLRQAAEHALDGKLKSQIRADLELLRAKGEGVPPPRTSRKPASAAPPPHTPPPPFAPPSFTAEDFWHYVVTVIRAARLFWKLKRRGIFTVLALAAVSGIVYEGVSLHKSLLAKTTLSFVFSVDGKALPSGEAPVVQVDGQPFPNGSKIGLGRHELLVRLKDTELFKKHFWVFYGTKNLGAMPLESSKGSLSVTVNPSPAKVVLKRYDEVVRQGDAPLKIDKLSVGDYTLIIHRGEYEETHVVKIHRAQLTQGQIDLNLGSADLSSSPPDAEFDLAGNGRHWQGKLPVKLAEVPGGSYALAVSRKDWVLNKNISISHASVCTNITEFPYGSIAVTSDPPGLLVSSGGVEIGKTPTTLRELKPGQYVVSITDGENELVSVVAVGPQENASHSFVFRYGTVQLSSTPPGATVIRKGKEVGTTTLTLEHIPTETTAVALRLDNFATVNVPIHAETGFTTNYAVKLFSKRYLAAMDAAKQALAANEFESARQFVAAAIETDSTDPTAPALLTEINRQAEIWRQQQVETARLAAEAKARRIAAELAAIPTLNPESIIQSCWHTPDKSDKSFSKLNAIDAAHSNPAAVPIAAATDVIVKGIEIIAWPFHKAKAINQPRFNEGYFANTYRNNVYRYYGKITNVDANNKTITFAIGGKSKQSFVVSTHFQNEAYSSALTLKPGSPVWVSGQLTALEESNPANRLLLENGTVYSPNTLPAPN